MRRFLPLAFLLVLLTAGCAEEPTVPAPVRNDAGADARPDTIPRGYDVRGLYLGPAYDSAAALVDHEAISGVMPAMRMPVRVDDRSLLRGLREGDKIRFRLNERDGTGYVMIDAEKLPPDTPLALADNGPGAVPAEDPRPEDPPRE